MATAALPDRSTHSNPAPGKLERLSFWLLIGVVVLAPLPLGGNRPWAWSLLALAVAAIAVLWAAAALIDGKTVRLPMRRFAVPGALFIVALIWFAVQAASWTPSDWHAAIWQDAARALGMKLDGAISHAPDRTIDGLMRFLSYGILFLLFAQFAREPRQARQIVIAIAAAATAYALYGLIVFGGGNDRILHYEKWAYLDSLTATFVNRNSFATYTGLGLVACIGLLVRELRDTGEFSLLSRTGIIHLLESLRLPVFLLITAILILASALVLTGSRGGLAAAIGGAAVFAAALMLRPGRSRRRPLVLLGGGLVVLLIVLQASGGRMLERYWTAGAEDSSRIPVYEMTWEAFREKPVTGHGLNSFPDVFLLRRDTRLDPETPPHLRAHNGYLEILAEGGLIGGVTILATLVFLAGACAVGIRRRRRRAIYPCIALSAAALIGLHAMVDFSIQIPAVAVSFLALLAAGYAQAWNTAATPR